MLVDRLLERAAAPDTRRRGARLRGPATELRASSRRQACRVAAAVRGARRPARRSRRHPPREQHRRGAVDSRRAARRGGVRSHQPDDQGRQARLRAARLRRVAARVRSAERRRRWPMPGRPRPAVDADRADRHATAAPTVAFPFADLRAGGRRRHRHAHLDATRSRSRRARLHLGFDRPPQGRDADARSICSRRRASINGLPENHPTTTSFSIVLPLSFDYGLYQLFLAFAVGRAGAARAIVRLSRRRCST